MPAHLQCLESLRGAEFVHASCYQWPLRSREPHILQFLQTACLYQLFKLRNLLKLSHTSLRAHESYEGSTSMLQPFMSSEQNVFFSVLLLQLK